MTIGFLRCPDCSSAVRPGVDWCSLCHADLRPPEDRSVAAAMLPAAPDVGAPEATDEELELAGGVPSAGRHARRVLPVETRIESVLAEPVAAFRGSDPLASIDVEGMLATLAATDAPLVGAAGRFSSKGTVALYAFGGAAVLTVVSLAAMFILGSFLH